MTLESIEKKQDYMNNLKDGLIDFVAGSLGKFVIINFKYRVIVAYYIFLPNSFY